MKFQCALTLWMPVTLVNAFPVKVMVKCFLDIICCDNCAVTIEIAFHHVLVAREKSMTHNFLLELG